jgi:hypothetical protein
MTVFYFLVGLLLPMFFDARWRTKPWRRPACFPQPERSIPVAPAQGCLR